MGMGLKAMLEAEVKQDTVDAGEVDLQEEGKPSSLQKGTEHSDHRCVPILLGPPQAPSA